MSENIFLQQTGIKQPIICGPMYPCSNPELVAAVSNAGGLGIIQPVSLTYVHGYQFAEGLDYIRSLTQQPVGMNLLIEKSSKKYHQRMQQWLDIALQKDIRFFITSLGKPDWVVKRVHEAGGLVYHDVTEARWAQKAADLGVDGLIGVNRRAGGHTGSREAEQLYKELSQFGLPLVCAGGIADAASCQSALSVGYQAVQIGTRFIVSTECNASEAYKQAIIHAHEDDIVLTERLTGIAVSVINTAFIKKTGLKPNPLEQWLLKHPAFKYFMRTLLALKSLRSFKQAHLSQSGKKDYWQAGRGVDAITEVLPVKEIIHRLTQPIVD